MLASSVMTDMGAPPEMVDTMASAAQDGFDQAIETGMSPADAFDAAGESVDAAFGEGPMGAEGDMGAAPDMVSLLWNQKVTLQDDR